MTKEDTKPKSMAKLAAEINAAAYVRFKPVEILPKPVEIFPQVVTWWGRRVNNMTKSELLEMVQDLAQEIELLRADLELWRKAANPIKYLMEKMK